MIIPLKLADGKTDLRPLLKALDDLGEFEGFERCEEQNMELRHNLPLMLLTGAGIVFRIGTPLCTLIPRKEG